MISDRYERVDIDPVLYEPEDHSYTRFQKLGRRLFCGATKRQIEKAEKFLSIYNKERYKIASLVYSVATYMSPPGETIKGIAMNAKKEDFYTATLKDVQGDISDLYGSFVKKRRFIRIAIIVALTLPMLGILGSLYPAMRNALSTMILTGVNIGFTFLLMLVIVVKLCIFSTVEDIEKRLKCAKDENVWNILCAYMTA